MNLNYYLLSHNLYQYVYKSLVILQGKTSLFLCSQSEIQGIRSSLPHGSLKLFWFKLFAHETTDFSISYIKLLFQAFWKCFGFETLPKCSKQSVLNSQSFSQNFSTCLTAIFVPLANTHFYSHLTITGKMWKDVSYYLAPER